ncbi:MAG: hypothetical protein ACI4QT_03515, partial [Kiritimatiellia bacterium]
MSSRFQKRFAFFLKRFREAPDAEGIGIIRMLLLSVVVGLFAGCGALLLTSLLQLTNWMFLGKLCGVVLKGAANEPEPFPLPAISRSVRPLLLFFLP